MHKRAPLKEKTCVDCTAQFVPNSGRQKWCKLCYDKNGNKARKGKKPPWMIVHVDLEGEQYETPFGQRMYMVTASYGREDGTRESFVPAPVDMSQEDWPLEYDLRTKVAMRWLINRLHSRKYYIDKDGKKWRQQPMAFHFGWDTAVLSKSFTPSDMHLVRKVQSTIETILCGKRHKPGESCSRYDHEYTEDELAAIETGELEEGEKAKGVLHRYSSEDVLAVITDGGDSDVAAYDPESAIAFAATPGRRFYMEHRPNGDRFEGWRKTDLHDVGRSFVGGLESAIDEWLTPEDYFPGDREIIRRGKERRKTGFKGFTIRDVADYSEAECVAAARMTRKLLDALKAALNLPISEPRLFGSGSIATSALKHFGVPKAKDCNLNFEEIAKLTYFGGLIEADVVGLIPLTIDELDINSAYPSKMIHLPCMTEEHGHWVDFEEDDFPEDATVGHIRAAWWCHDLDTGKAVETSTGPFTARYKDMRVVSGMSCDGIWTTLPEYRVAMKRFGPTMIEGMGGRYWKQTCGCGNPFAWLGKIYDERLKVKAQMKKVKKGTSEYNNLNSLQLAYKLVINSIYGKLAQQRPNRSSYTNFHLAAYITGATRAQVREESWLREAQGGTVVYQHTDSVLSVGGKPEDGGKGLGAWGLETDKITHIFFCLQPGLAACLSVKWNEDKKMWETDGKVATRGCRPQDFLNAALKYRLDQNLQHHPTTWRPFVIEQRIMNGWRVALAQGKPELAGAFLDKVYEFSPASHKRDLARAVPFTYAPDPDKPLEIVEVKTAWRVPPLAHVDNDQLAGVDDLKQHQSMMDRRYKEGEFDYQGG